MTAKPAQMHFDYDSLDPHTRAYVRERAAWIHHIARVTAEGIRRIGQYLTEVKARLKHGQFRDWIKKEFGWERSSADNFMHVFENIKCPNFGHLEIDVSALYLIAAPKTPEPVRADLMRRAEAGEPITHQGAVAVIDQFKKTGDLPPKEKPLPSPEEARKIAIETGNHTLDSTGTYQPPVSLDQQRLWSQRMRAFDAVCSYAASDLVNLQPAELLDGLTELHCRTRLRGISLDAFIDWLTAFERERKKRYGS